ncbi:unnamed protein product [Linum trigynum]|uniref:NTF2-related export protein n=1 Tax=Linum trigynum TaxID=586398 RepID=A0AAV2DIA2_9ROSI
MEEQVETLGKAFVDHYYHLFDADRSSLSSLYQPTSMLTFEGQKFVGAADITAKLRGLPFDQCKHAVSTIDSQAAAGHGWHRRVRQRQPASARRGASPPVQPDVSLASDDPRDVLRVERHFPTQLWLIFFNVLDSCFDLFILCCL